MKSLKFVSAQYRYAAKKETLTAVGGFREEAKGGSGASPNVLAIEMCISGLMLLNLQNFKIDSFDS